jgi:polysaccharide biosynthesis transport protein
MNFTQFLAIVRARKWIGLSILVLTVALTLGFSLLWPKQYTASASVVVDVRPDPIAGIMLQGFAVPSIVATQIDVMTSDRVSQRVVRILKLNENPQVRQQWQDETNGQAPIEVWLGDLFRRNLDVRPSRESNVISLSYKAAEPRFAAGIANAFVQAYMDTTLELRVDPARQYSSFFETRAKEARETLEKAQSRLSIFQKENGIIAADERFDIENQRLNELSSQLVAIQAISSESASREKQAVGAQASSMQEVLNNPVLSSLKLDQSRSEARLQELNARLGDNHPQVLEVKATIAELRARIDAETRKVTGGVGVSNTINRSREATLRADLAAQRGQVLRMKAVRDEAQVLMREVENAQRAFDAVQQRLTQSSLESQTTLSYVNVLSAATPPLEPSSPRILLNTIVSVFLGIVIALVAMLVRELFDRRLRSATDISDVLGVPMLGTLPTMRKRRLFGGKASVPALQNRILGRLPSNAKAA